MVTAWQLKYGMTRAIRSTYLQPPVLVQSIPNHDNIFRVTSQRAIEGPNGPYITKKNANGVVYTCTCEDWQQRQVLGGCKHMIATQTQT